MAEARFCGTGACGVDRPPALFSQVVENPRPLEPVSTSSTAEVVQGRGAGTPAYSQEALVNNTGFAGMEVSSQELLVAVSRNDQTLPLKSFPNSPEGHRAVAD